jgi:hypothetical protein
MDLYIHNVANCLSTWVTKTDTKSGINWIHTRQYCDQIGTRGGGSIFTNINEFDGLRSAGIEIENPCQSAPLLSKRQVPRIIQLQDCENMSKRSLAGHDSLNMFIAYCP